MQHEAEIQCTLVGRNPLRPVEEAGVPGRRLGLGVRDDGDAELAVGVAAARRRRGVDRRGVVTLALKVQPAETSAAAADALAT